MSPEMLQLMHLSLLTRDVWNPTTDDHRVELLKLMFASCNVIIDTVKTCT